MSYLKIILKSSDRNPVSKTGRWFDRSPVELEQRVMRLMRRKQQLVVWLETRKFLSSRGFLKFFPDVWEFLPELYTPVVCSYLHWLTQFYSIIPTAYRFDAIIHNHISLDKKIVKKSRYLCNDMTDLHEIWCNDAE